MQTVIVHDPFSISPPFMLHVYLIVIVQFPVIVLKEAINNIS